jgi:hypothetical protein
LRVAWRAFDILLRLPDAPEELPDDVKRLMRVHAGALMRLGVPVGSGNIVFDSIEDKASDFDRELQRVGQSLLLVEGEGGQSFGAWIAVRWPKVGKREWDVRCRSFLFTLDGGEAKRVPAVTAPAVYHDLRAVSVGELTLGRREYWVNTGSSCTGGRFPALSRKGR